MPTKNAGKKAKIFKISIYCKVCDQLLYVYQKEGPGSLVKCYEDRIAKDYTKGDLKCPSCGQDFARHAVMRMRPVHKIIQGKVYTKGHVKK